MEDALKLEYEAKNGWSLLDEGARKELTAFCEDYKKFLDDAKTEVEATEVLTAAAKAAGFLRDAAERDFPAVEDQDVGA